MALDLQQMLNFKSLLQVNHNLQNRMDKNRYAWYENAKAYEKDFIRNIC